MTARSVRLVSARIARWGAALLLVVGLVVLPGLPQARAAVPSGNQLRLDGVDDYAGILDNPSLDLGDEPGEDFTIEAFIYVPDETSDANQIVFYKGSAYSLSINFNPVDPDAIFVRLFTGVSTYGQLLQSTHLQTGWHHVAAVYDNEWTTDNDRLALYLDGAEFAVQSPFDYTPGIYGSSNLLSVGANSGAAPFDGWLDEARFSSSVRYSGAYAVPSSPFAPDGDTRALWHFDDAACASSFIDSSGNGNTLAAQGGATTGLQGAAAPTLQFSSSTYTVAESDGSATVTVTRTGDPLPVVGVDHTTTDGTASAGSDYTDTEGSLNFACGDMEETLSVPITRDALVEPDETVSLGLATPTGGASLGSPSSATLTIQDEDVTPPDTSITEGPTGATKDATPTFAFTSTEADSTFECRVDSSSYAACTSPHTTAALADGAHTFYVRAIDAADNPDPSAASRSFTVDTVPPETYLTDGPTGTTNDPTPTFTFSADEAGSTFECRIDDEPFTTCTSPHTTPTLPDDSYAFSVRAIDGATNVDATPADFSFSVDTAPPSIRFQQDGSAFQEDAGTVELLVVRGGYEGVAISADFEVTGGTAAGGSDYTVTPGTLDFDAGELNDSITVTIADDPTAEGPETVVVTLLNPGGGAVLGSPSSTTLTIGASDQQPDALISNLVASKYIGDGIYNADAAGQTKKATQVPGKKRVFYVRIANDGTMANTFKLKGTPSPKGATVKYFLNDTALNITVDMLSKAGYAVGVDAGTWETIKVVIKLKDTAVPGTKKTASVTASWAGDGVLKDVVKAVVKVKG